MIQLGRLGDVGHRCDNAEERWRNRFDEVDQRGLFRVVSGGRKAVVVRLTGPTMRLSS